MHDLRAVLLSIIRSKAFAGAPLPQTVNNSVNNIYRLQNYEKKINYI